MLGGAVLQNWQPLSLSWFHLLRRVPCMLDSICGECVAVLGVPPCHPLATRAGGETAHGVAKVKAKVAWDGFTTPPSVPLAYIQLPPQPLPRNQIVYLLSGLLYI